MNPSAKREIARQTGKKTPHPSQYAQNLDEIVIRNSLNDCLTFSSRHGGVVQMFLSGLTCVILLPLYRCTKALPP
jgi:hypothetical protein